VARGAPVIVMYMAMKHLEQIAAALIAAGRNPGEPVAIVCSATTPEQAVLETTLGACAGALAAAGLEPPAIVVIGEVVRLRAALDWLGALDGKKLVPDPLGLKAAPGSSETA
jgi:uroporphyrin-III C-methyltransferase